MPVEWKDVSKWLTDATNRAVAESKELARKGKLQYDILGLRHEITQALTELGSRVYEMLQKDKDAAVAADARVLELVKRTRSLELDLKRKERDKAARKYT
jgi:hypothetical protein